MGQSVFDKNLPGRAYNFTDYHYWYLDNEAFIEFGPTGLMETKNVLSPLDFNEAEIGDPQVSRATQNLKAVLHYLNNGLINNRLYSWEESL